MSTQSSVCGEEVLEYSPIHSSVSLSKQVDCQGQPLDTYETLESSFMEFLESVRIRAIQTGTDMGQIQVLLLLLLLFVCLFVCLFVYLFLFVCLFICLFVCLFVCFLFVCLFVCLFVY